jgi:alpha-glucosidase
MLAEDVKQLPDSNTSAPWWKGAAIYQIYPRSFADSNGDGVGDLPGFTAHLDYVAKLGVDAIWLSPFFKSPMRDFGYDISDYCAVDPVFGTMDDFDRLVARAHDLDLKVIVDQVYSHSSDQHPWFQESRSSRANGRTDWYVWADAKLDGSPPNNWQSVFGGPAWQWDARREQYYLHNFLREQPDLNLHNREVQDAILGVARFWLDRGVDGFRIDAINFAMHDPSLRDNPPAANGSKRTRPFDFQQHLYNQSHPAIVDLLERLRSVTGDAFTVAEVGGTDPLAEMRAFTSGNHRLNSAYGFDFLYAEQLTPALVAQAVRDWPDAPDAGWPTWAFENHDAPRAVSRWCSGAHCDLFVRMKTLLLTALRGSVILYQGEELGLPQVDVPFDQLRDPEAIANWPQTLSRDGARTPIPWDSNAPSLGFSSGQPWLPAAEDHRPLAVDVQEAHQGSALEFTRRCLAVRRDNPALRTGSVHVVEAGDRKLIIDRSVDGRLLRCTFNFSDGEVPFSRAGVTLVHSGAVADTVLGPYAALIEVLK